MAKTEIYVFSIIYDYIKISHMFIKRKNKFIFYFLKINLVKFNLNSEKVPRFCNLFDKI